MMFGAYRRAYKDGIDFFFPNGNFDPKRFRYHFASDFRALTPKSRKLHPVGFNYYLKIAKMNRRKDGGTEFYRGCFDTKNG